MEKQKLNTTLIYILSILGFLCCCFGGIGIVPSGIAFFIVNGKVKEYENAPENFENGEAMKTAKIIAMVVLIINILYLGYTIYRIATVGWDEMIEQSRELSEQWGFEQ